MMRADVVTLDDARALVVDASIPDDAPAMVREGLARRAIVNRGGTCPCGARAALPNRAERRRSRGAVLQVLVEHEADCPAGTEVILPALRVWERGQG